MLGISIAPDTPWITRKQTSTPIDEDSAHPSDASAKPAIPIANIRRRPNRSPSFPPGISSTASASR